MKVSFITTVFNEENTIAKLLDSLLKQTKKANEAIIVDGGSSDKTIEIIKKYEPRFKKTGIKLELFIKKGNRSVGRNEAVKKSSNNIIACSDAGNILDKNWLKNISEPFIDRQTDVVAGYYKGRAKNLFQKCLVPYVLVMPDKVNPEEFLPATRSIAFRKSAWRKVGGFDEKLSHNEDYVFANKLKKAGTKIFFSRNAIVYWIPRRNIKEAFKMFFRFAYGDAEGEIIRTKALLVFSRYFLGLYFIFLSVLYKSVYGFIIAFLVLIIYVLWSIIKNYKYEKEVKAVIILPVLQFVVDFAVLSGSSLGFIKRVLRFNYFSFFFKNKFVFFVIAIYCTIELYFLSWGAPNQYHPFPYFMDEWHQLNAVRATFAYGTSNLAGAANGTMLHFLLSGFFLSPFTLMGFTNPAVIRIDDYLMRERLFDLLRINTIFWGTFSIFLVYKISDYISASKKLAITLFTFTPIWLLLGGYFKYDIALIFWILLSIFMILRFAKEPSSRNFIIAGIPAALAVAVKVSAIPLLPIYVISFFIFGSWKKNIKFLVIGILVFGATLLLFGMPDVLFGRGNIIDYLYDNIVRTPSLTSNINLPFSPYAYLFTKHYPVVFGYGLVALSIFSISYWIVKFIREGATKYKIELFIILSFFIFLGSLLPLNIQAVGNRSLVLLPFFAIIISLTHRRLFHFRANKSILTLIVGIILVMQFFQVFSWLYIKFADSPQEKAALWIIENISEDNTIGVENIPIYQLLPDVIQEEFYYNEYGVGSKNNYKYEIVDVLSKDIPSYVVITNGEIEQKILKKSAKNDLVKKIKEDGYQRIAIFKPNLKFYKIFGTELDFYYSGNLIASPLTVSVYSRQSY